MERLIFDPSKLKIVDIDKIRPNTWNPKQKETEEFQKVKKSIEIKGLRLPIVVRQNNGYEIIDGEQRYTACQQLKYKKIWIYDEGKVSDKESKELTLWYQQQVPFDELELAKLIKEMEENYENLDIPFDADEIMNLTNMLNFDWESFNQATELKEGETKSISFTLNQDQYRLVMAVLLKVKEKINCDNADALAIVCEYYGSKKN